MQGEKENLNTVRIGIDSTELDEALKRASRLKDLLLEIEPLLVLKKII